MTTYDKHVPTSVRTTTPPLVFWMDVSFPAFTSGTLMDVPFQAFTSGTLTTSAARHT